MKSFTQYVEQHDFSGGYCHIFAVALHDTMGHKLHGLIINYEDEMAKFKHLPQGHVMEHVFGEKEGRFFDANGRYNLENELKFYRQDGAEVYVVPLTRNQVMGMSGDNKKDNFYPFDIKAYQEAVSMIHSDPKKWS